MFLTVRVHVPVVPDSLTHVVLLPRLACLSSKISELLEFVSTVSWSNQLRFEIPKTSLLTGLPDYAKLVNAPDWAQHYRMLLDREGTGDVKGSPDGSVGYNRRLPFGGGSGMYQADGQRAFPATAPLHYVEVHDQTGRSVRVYRPDYH